MDMPLPRPEVLSGKSRILQRLRAVLPADAVIEDEERQMLRLRRSRWGRLEPPVVVGESQGEP